MSSKQIVFFIIHFLGGCLLLWLNYINLQFVVEFTATDSLPVRAALETLYLVSGIVWGNLGWDRLKSISEESDLLSEIVETTAPITLFLPLASVILEFSLRLHQGGWQWAWYRMPIFPLALAAFTLMIIKIHRRFVAKKRQELARAHA